MPLPGENPELDAETKVPLLWAVSIVFVSISSIAVLLRLYTRHFVVKNVGLDDVTIAVAQVLSIGVSATTIIQAQYALGRHAWMTTEEGGIKQLKTLFAAMVIYNLSQIVTKVSFLLQYRRIFAEERTRRICFWLLLFLTAWGVTQEVLVGFACIPVGIFIPKMQDVCINALVVWYLTSVMNIITDFMVFMVPMPAIRGLQLRRKQKVMVTGIFCLGFFTCIISIVRLFALKQAINTEDPTWDNVPTSYWSVVELNTGILCACLPTLRPLVRKVVSDISGIRSGEYHQTADSNLKSTSTKPPGYTLKDINRSSSQEGLKEEDEAPNYYVPSDYAKHSGQVSTLSTAISGKSLPPRPDEGDWSSSSSPKSQHIKVTREIGMQETLEKR